MGSRGASFDIGVDGSIEGLYGLPTDDQLVNALHDSLSGLSAGGGGGGGYDAAGSLQSWGSLPNTSGGMGGGGSIPATGDGSRGCGKATAEPRAAARASGPPGRSARVGGADVASGYGAGSHGDYSTIRSRCRIARFQGS